MALGIVGAGGKEVSFNRGDLLHNLRHAPYIKPVTFCRAGVLAYHKRQKLFGGGTST